MNELTVDERVENGARWLDENFPGWEGRINIETLELQSTSDCICGQVFEEVASEMGVDGYDFAIDNLFTEANSWITALVPNDTWRRGWRVSETLGFCTYDGESEYAWAELQDSWVTLLEKRRAERGEMA
jgi:hypothetical protein